MTDSCHRMIAGGLSFISRSEDSIPSDAFDVCRMEAVPGRSNDLLSSEKRCNIAAREAPRAEGFEPSVVPCVVSTHLPSPDGSKGVPLSDKPVFVRQRSFSARPGAAPESRPLNLDIWKNSTKREKPVTSTRSGSMSSKISVSAGCLRRLDWNTTAAGLSSKESSPKSFAWCVSTRPLGRYVTRLNQFYEQIQRVGNNYNQIVRAVNTHFSHTAIPRQVLLLERRTRELKALSEQVIALSRELYELWSRECE